MTKICFASYEIHPTVKGGMGVFLFNAAKVLLPLGHEIIFLLDLDEDQFRQFNETDRTRLPDYDRCRAYRLQTLIDRNVLTPRNFLSVYEYQSHRFHLALKELSQIEKPDIIELFDYCGIGLNTLATKIAGLEFQNSRINIRLHGSIELIDFNYPSSRHGIDRYILYGLEHQALRLAESVLYPSEAFLKEAYLPFYEPWFGRMEFSDPPLLGHPEPLGSTDEQDIVLYFGRLHGIKGVDTFVDAAITYLDNTSNPRRLFYLVGYDSYLPPTGRGSYRSYLLEKIPFQYREYFTFTGQLTWQELGRLLPSVSFAVIPSYLESFCYAAHELYQAGIPLILSDIPAFKDTFQHGHNALKFNGSVYDLFEKMSVLSQDQVLRRRLIRPESIPTSNLEKTYNQVTRESWINEGASTPAPTLLICVLADHPAKLSRTLHSLREIEGFNSRIVVMHPVRSKKDSVEEPAAPIWFLGGWYVPKDIDNTFIYSSELLTADSLLLLTAGDEVQPEFIRRSLDILQRQSQISYVSCWKKRRSWKGDQVDTLMIEAVFEISPFIKRNLRYRCVMRTIPGSFLVDLFDSRMGRFGEFDYLMKLETEKTTGLTIPEIFMTVDEKKVKFLDENRLDFLTYKSIPSVREKRLSRFHLTVNKRWKVLQTFQYETTMGDPFFYELNQIVYRIATSRFSKMMDRFPKVKSVISRSVLALLSVPARLGKKRL